MRRTALSLLVVVESRVEAFHKPDGSDHCVDMLGEASHSSLRIEQKESSADEYCRKLFLLGQMCDRGLELPRDANSTHFKAP